MGDKCKHGYKDGEYCIQCDKPEYIKSLQSKVAELEKKSKRKDTVISYNNAVFQEEKKSKDAEIERLRGALEKDFYDSILFSLYKENLVRIPNTGSCSTDYDIQEQIKKAIKNIIRTELINTLKPDSEGGK